CRARYQPSALPKKTSEGKCCFSVTRVKVTVEAKVYAKILVKGPGYSCATTLATVQASALCSDGKELPPCQKDPFPLPSSGRCRMVVSLRANAIRVLLSAASPLRKPVSRRRSLPVNLPIAYEPTAAPTSENTA